MSFYIRFLLTDQRPLSIKELETALREISHSYAIEGDVVTFEEFEFGLIDVAHRGDPTCDDDLDLLMRLAEKKRNRELIQATLRITKSLICVQFLSTHDARTREILAPLWDWLLANRTGLLAWEGGRFFDGNGELK